MKVAEDAAQELPLNDERQPEPELKKNRHVVIALNHMRKRRATLEQQDRKLQKELEEIDAAILALE
jgi:hypothetical protein